MLRLKGGDTSKFDREVGANFKKSAKGSRVPNTEEVAIDQIMLVCQRENGINMAYGDPDGFGCPGMMGLWDLYSSDALSWVKMQLVSGRVDANFCPMCLFWSTNNETLNNHVHKHYKMGLTSHSNSFMTASVAAMKADMEAKHGYEGKHGAEAKKQKGKGSTVPSEALSLHGLHPQCTPVTPVASNLTLCLHRHILTNYCLWCPDAAPTIHS